MWADDNFTENVIADFLKKQIETKTVWHITAQKKKEQKNKKHSGVLKIGAPNRKNPRKWNYEWSYRVNTCTPPTVSIFE